MDIEQRLSQMKLFEDLSPEDRARWAAWFERREFARGDIVVRQDEPATEFYIVEHGELRAFVIRDERREPVAVFYEGDYFGETGLLTGAPRNATVEVLADAVLFVLGKDHFEQLMAEFPSMREQLRAKGKVREAIGRMRFPWQVEDEVTVIFAKKHWIELLRELRLVIVLGILSFVTTLVYTQVTIGALPAAILTIISGSLLGLTGLLFIYQFLNWRNDYYIVTNFRVLHVERVLLLREDRDEAPIERVQDVQIRQKNILANVLNFGDVIVQTAAATENVVFSNIPRPDEVKDAILAPKQRERDVSQERELIRQDLEDLLGLKRPSTEEPSEGETAPVQPAEDAVGAFDLTDTLSGGWQWFRGLFNFQTWIESPDRTTITWRKNGWLLISASLAPFLIAGALLAASLFIFSRGLGTLSVGMLLFILMLIDFGWWFYLYWDWQNDIYQVSDNRLIDLKRRPLFLEEIRRETTLDNVQNISLSIPGPIAQLLNFGTVIIETAGERGAFRFEHVHNPRGVQQEIFRRREKLNRARQERMEQEQRARMLMWFEEYEQVKQQQRATRVQPESDHL